MSWELTELERLRRDFADWDITREDGTYVATRPGYAPVCDPSPLVMRGILDRLKHEEQAADVSWHGP